MDNGALSGVGYGGKSAWAAAFFGYLNGVERLPELDARTTTDSTVVGAQGQVRAGGLSLGLMAAYDRAQADTQRSAPGDIAASGRYALKSWVADANISYYSRLDADWAVVPQLTASYVRTNRDGVAEQGGGAFALTVQGARSTNWFIDGRFEFDGGQAAGAALHPFGWVGFVTRGGGQDGPVSASLNGLPVPLTADGLELDGLRAALGGGLRYDLSRRLKTSVSYDGEFGNNGRQRLMLGLNWAF